MSKTAKWIFPLAIVLAGVNTREEQLIETVDALLREQRAVDPAHPTM